VKKKTKSEAFAKFCTVRVLRIPRFHFGKNSSTNILYFEFEKRFPRPQLQDIQLTIELHIACIPCPSISIASKVNVAMCCTLVIDFPRPGHRISPLCTLHMVQNRIRARSRSARGNGDWASSNSMTILSRYRRCTAQTTFTYVTAKSDRVCSLSHFHISQCVCLLVVCSFQLFVSCTL
jgi:hypothetical protein